MSSEDKTTQYNNQRFSIGLDVHKKMWSVTLRSGGLHLKTFSMNPSPEELRNYLEKNYPGGKYNSVYEAGFCGYWIHRRLEELGIKNKIVSPTDIPTSISERLNKSDKIDSRKLARELEKGTMKGIYIPSQLQQELRSLVRLRHQLIKSQTRIKNQIKSYLNFYGHSIPENFVTKHWSHGFIEQLRKLEFSFNIGKTQLEIYLSELEEKKKLLFSTIKQIREYCDSYGLKAHILHLCSIPGIGFITAITVYTELIDISRFTKLNNLASYVGLVPLTQSTYDHVVTLGIKKQHNVYLRSLLIEAAWIAVRKDPELLTSYSSYVRRMSKQEAIIRIAKKLLFRFACLWKNNIEYKLDFRNKKVQ